MAAHLVSEDERCKPQKARKERLTYEQNGNIRNQRREDDVSAAALRDGRMRAGESSMLQNVATIVSITLAMGALALIARILADDWRSVVRALRDGRDYQPLPLAVPSRPTIGDRRARVVRVSSQSAPRRAAA